MQIKHDDRVAENKVMEGGRCAWRLRHGNDADASVFNAKDWLPHFLSQETKPLDGVIRFGFTVVLPSNDRGLELVAHGPVSVNDHDARQEASFVMLEKLIYATGLAIHDYNYRIICD
ncbi:hypothetical protein AHAS_Ahas16G0103100 [Arachis hypogaea]